MPIPGLSVIEANPLFCFTWSKIEKSSVGKSVINIFFSVVSNSNIDFDGNSPPGISGREVSKCRFTATLKAEPHTWLTIGMKLAWANADIFKYKSDKKYDVIVSNPPYVTQSEQELMKSNVV